MKESLVLSACIQWLYLHKVTFWRNQSGAVKTKEGHWIRFGNKGSPDIMCRIPITHAGRTFPCLVAIECKADKGRLSPEQIAWRKSHEADGGIYIEARSIDDLEALKYVFTRQ